MKSVSTEIQNEKVISLFNREEVIVDPLQNLLNEMEFEAQTAPEVPVVAPTRRLVTARQFPDQSMHILDVQLNELTDKLDRLKFYLSDLEDLIPHRY